MKKIIKIFALVISLNIVFAIFPGEISAQRYDVNFQVFYDQLNPYGQWIENTNYGYIWYPTAGPDFTPYLSNGYWLLTVYGWTWISDYDWGWATFHYGRWDYDDFYGWFWVPDHEWGPSWVTWRRSEGYYGWAPMRPGVSLNIAFGRDNDERNDRWIFVRDRDIERHDNNRNHIDRRNNINIFNNSTVINKTYYDDKRSATYIAGPGREDVQKITGTTIKPFAVAERAKPGQSLNNDQLQIYRPRVENNNSGYKPVPTELTNVKDVKQISERDAEKRPQNTQPQNRNLGDRQQQPVVNPPNTINRNDNLPEQRNRNLPNDRVNTGQQPVVNPPNTINRKENIPEQRDRNLPNDKVNTGQQPVVNPPNTINRNDNLPEQRNRNLPNDKVNTGQQPVVNPPNTINRNDNLPPQRNTNTPNDRINTGRQQPVVNLPNTIKSNNNLPPQRNTNAPNDKINTGRQQPIVNPPNTIKRNNDLPAQRNVDPPKKEDGKNRQLQQQKINMPMNNNRANQPPKVQTVNPSPNNVSNQPPKVQTINPPTNNRTNQPPKVQTINPPKNDRIVQPPKPNPNDEKKDK